MKLLINPGHGGSDPGAVGNGLREVDINWAIAKRLETKLTPYCTIKTYHDSNLTNTCREENA